MGIWVLTDFPKNAGKFAKFSKNVATCLTGNAALASPPVDGITLAAQANAVVAADVPRQQRSEVTLAARASAVAVLARSLRQDAAYVQATCDALPLDQARKVAVNSGFDFTEPTAHAKLPYAIRRGGASGKVRVIVKLVGWGVMFCHAYSVDGGKTWVELPPTLAALTPISGLPVGTTVCFRYRTLIKGTYGDWSQIQAFLIY